VLQLLQVSCHSFSLERLLIPVNTVFALNILVREKKVGEEIWGKYVPEALAGGRLKAAPEPMVIGHGLDKMQAGLDRQKQGVSAAKVVITL